MAPTTLPQIDDTLKTTIQSLYALLLQSHAHEGAATAAAQRRTLEQLATSLATLSARSPGLPVRLPPEVLQYVEAGRNPDIYTREFVEAAQRANQRARGRAAACARFRDVLARELVGAVPEVRAEVVRVVRATGGVVGEDGGIGG